jgi:hypothetical protein
MLHQSITSTFSTKRRRPNKKTTAKIPIPSTNRLKISYINIPSIDILKPHISLPISIAIIIPHRNRIEHLSKFITHIQSLDTHGNTVDIYVIDQDNMMKFNRGFMLNIGFGISHSINTYTRYIFHDVDSYPDQSMFDYYFSHKTKLIHFASPYLGYKYNYDMFMGGVIGLSKDDYMKINGFPNTFWGWGGEDDALRYRLAIAKMHVYRPSTGYFTLEDHPGPTDAEYNMLKRDNRIHDAKSWKTNGIKQILDIPFRLSYYLYDDFFIKYNEQIKPSIAENIEGVSMTAPIPSKISEYINIFFCKISIAEIV